MNLISFFGPSFVALVQDQADVQQANVWISLSSGLIGAILGAVIAAIATVNLQHWRSSQSRKKEQKFKIYMLIHEAYGKHFWIASADMRGEIAKEEIRGDFERICWKIADELRTIDNIPETATILHILFSLRFNTETDRAKAFAKLIDDMGRELNPNYSKVMKQLSEELPQFGNINEFFERQRKIRPTL